VRVIFLGTGTSHGVPLIGCDCAVCRSSDSRDARLRPSIVLELAGGTTVLVDTTPDLRTQALRHNLRRVDAILFTHAHADHVMGLDEVRRYNMLTRQPVPVFGDEATLADIKRTFAYAFAPDAPRGGGVPDLRLWNIGGPFVIFRQEVVPLRLRHGPWQVLGFRVGRFAYLTDCNDVPAEAMAQLGGLDCLVLDALRHRPHPTHFTVAQAVKVAKLVGAGRTLFTHISHDLGHEATCASLPDGMALAFDGQSLEIRDA
jgi:phosphoribosyl 1,2-cyclic phosphate phosphodiesterase